MNNIHSRYGDERWKTWIGVIEIKFDYEIVGKRLLATPLGTLECYEIKSTGTSVLGNSHLTAFFNAELGFVKLEYTNIDSTRLVLDLVDFKKSTNSN
ncbi:MAG: hypothetical protein M3Q56_06065 [Bacteroidota bacterium]|nr:hypothetical protein [Bacteroidota bacterium]MDQ3141796.1 hypothetical protein [Bacteroidota bacterium]